MSCPIGAIRIRPKRNPSAPYFVIKSSGSGELPNDFDILRPCLSRISPVKKTSRNGMLSSMRSESPGLNSSPAMIMRATQKKMMSGPVTSAEVG